MVSQDVSFYLEIRMPPVEYGAECVLALQWVSLSFRTPFKIPNFFCTESCFTKTLLSDLWQCAMSLNFSGHTHTDSRTEHSQPQKFDFTNIYSGKDLTLSSALLFSLPHLCYKGWNFFMFLLGNSYAGKPEYPGLIHQTSDYQWKLVWDLNGKIIVCRYCF